MTVARQINAGDLQTAGAKVFLPDVSGTGAAATNTSAIQALLNAGGVIWLLGSGVAYISSTLIAKYSTRLMVDPRLTIRAVANMNSPLLVNDGFNTRATTSSVTLSWSAGNTASCAWTAHGRSVGDYICVSGSNQSYFNGVVKVASVVDANNLTYTTLRLPTTSPTGTVVAKVCDKDITIEGGIWDYNYPNSNGTTAVDRHAMVLGYAQNVRVKNAAFVNAQKFCVHLGAVRDSGTENVTAPSTNSDIVKVYGPAFNCQVVNTSGLCGDDGVSYQTKEVAAFSTYMWTFGDIINCALDGTDIEQTSGSGIAMLYASANEYMGGIVVRNIGGATVANAVGVYAGYASSVLDDVLIENVNALATTGLNVNSAGFSLSVNSIELRDYVFNPSSTTSSASAIGISSGVTAASVTINGFSINNAAWLSASAAYLISHGGSVDQFNILNAEIRTAASGGNTRFLNYSAAASGRTLNIDKVSLKGVSSDNFLVISSGVTGTPNISIRDSDIDSTAIVNSSASINLALNGNRFGAATSGVLRTGGTPTIAISGDGNTLASGSWIVVPSGTPVINPKSFDVQVDLSATGIARATGNYAYNTNAALGTLGAAGPAVCQGAAANSWRLQGDPTLRY